MVYNVLIAEDDADIVELLSLYLDSNNFKVFTANNGVDALKIIKTNNISIILVDIMMPKMNGYELIKNIRQFSNIPIIILSAKSMDNDKILGLDLGADAYITKPFNPLEVVSYTKAALRRYYKLGSEPNEDKQASSIISCGDLELDTEKFILKKHGKTVCLTSTELKILAKMMKTPERVYTKSQLYECINGELYENDENTMMVHISNIRSKIEDDPSSPQYVKTVRGLGYKFENKKI